jgi:hypothetical protein
MKKIIKTGVAILITTSIFTGCATITQDSAQPVTFNSIPEGAKVYVNGQLKGKTPMTIQIEKGDKNQFKLMKEGYSTIEKPLETEVDGWFWGNIIFGGVLGSTTDNMSGNMYEFTPNSYMIELKKK